MSVSTGMHACGFNVQEEGGWSYIQAWIIGVHHHTVSLGFSFSGENFPICLLIVIIIFHLIISLNRLKTSLVLFK